jgi:hypothetical protein
MKWRLELKRIYPVSLVAIGPRTMFFHSSKPATEQSPYLSPCLSSDLVVASVREIQFLST